MVLTLVQFSFIMLFINLVPRLSPILSCNFSSENVINSLPVFQNNVIISSMRHGPKDGHNVVFDTVSKGHFRPVVEASS
jgi:hypothetical protein